MLGPFTPTPEAARRSGLDLNSEPESVLRRLRCMGGLLEEQVTREQAAR